MRSMRVILLSVFLSLSLPIIAMVGVQDIDSVVIKYASWSIITDIGIDCTNFENSIDYKIVVKSDSNSILQLVCELDHLKTALKGGEDIRCKLDFYSSGNIIKSCCLGNIITKIEGAYYYTTHSLMAAIDAIVESSPTRNEEAVTFWDSSLSVNKVSCYLSNQSDRIYKNISLYDDLSFTVYCYVDKNGKTQSTRFSKNRKGEKKEDLPLHVISVIQDILTHEVTWDVPQNFNSQWIPINVAIKKNTHSP